VTHALSRIHESPTVERVVTSFGFTEGALWHPDGFLDFVDIRRSQLWPGLPDALHGIQAGMERLNTHTRRSLSDLAAYHPLLPCIRRLCRPYSHALVSGF
jgi:hypothetical protein